MIKKIWEGRIEFLQFFNEQKNRNKLIKELIEKLYLFSKTNKNEQKIQILIQIYKEIYKYNKDSTFDIEDIECKEEDILEDLYFLLANIFTFPIELVLSRIARFIKTLGGEPEFLLTEIK
ncbi:hypothetical protein H2278_04015 [Campylobacter sp. W0018]|uniref:hypothetical protein n=1 Tax=Campylobacter sp. W0018 TaxID=2735782 RepID=UPI00301D1568|nr:hypothetical protein [Campylobacter sp. W0018]